MSYIEMTVEEWEETYRPLVNHLDDNASWQSEDGRGIMFETYGAELDFVRGCDENHIWTYADGDDGTYLSNGFGFVNRIGYFVTQKAFDPDAVIVITVSKDDEDE